MTGIAKSPRLTAVDSQGFVFEQQRWKLKVYPNGKKSEASVLSDGDDDGSDAEESQWFGIYLLLFYSASRKVPKPNVKFSVRLAWCPLAHAHALCCPQISIPKSGAAGAGAGDAKAAPLVLTTTHQYFSTAFQRSSSFGWQEAFRLDALESYMLPDEDSIYVRLDIELLESKSRPTTPKLDVASDAAKAAASAPAAEAAAERKQPRKRGKKGPAADRESDSMAPFAEDSPRSVADSASPTAAGAAAAASSKAIATEHKASASSSAAVDAEPAARHSGPDAASTPREINVTPVKPSLAAIAAAAAAASSASASAGAAGAPAGSPPSASAAKFMPDAAAFVPVGAFARFTPSASPPLIVVLLNAQAAASVASWARLSADPCSSRQVLCDLCQTCAQAVLLQMRGLPFTATQEKVRSWFGAGVQIGQILSQNRSAHWPLIR